jgi:hypothetical protein
MRSCPHASGSPEDEFDRLMARSAELEAKITATFEKSGEPFEDWKEALKAVQLAREKELAFLGQAQFLRPIRHLDMTRTFQLSY